MNTITFGSKNPTKMAQKLVDNVGEYARGFNMASDLKLGKLTEDFVDIQKSNAVLNGNKSFLEGLMNGINKFFSKKST